MKRDNDDAQFEPPRGASISAARAASHHLPHHDAEATRLLLEPDAVQLASDAAEGIASQARRQEWADIDPNDDSCRSSEHQRRDIDLAQGFGVGLLGRPPEREVVESDDVGAVDERIDKGRGLDNAPVGSTTAPCVMKVATTALKLLVA